MLNNVTLVARIKEIKELDCETTIIVEIAERNETTKIQILIQNQIKNAIKEYCKINDIVGIHGQLKTIKGKTIVIAKRLTFLSSSYKEEE